MSISDPCRVCHQTAHREDCEALHLRLALDREAEWKARALAAERERDEARARAARIEAETWEKAADLAAGTTHGSLANAFAAEAAEARKQSEGK